MQGIEYPEGCLMYLHTWNLGIWFAESIGMFRVQDLTLWVSLLHFFFPLRRGKRQPQHIGDQPRVQALCLSVLSRTDFIFDQSLQVVFKSNIDAFFSQDCKLFDDS